MAIQVGRVFRWVLQLLFSVGHTRLSFCGKR
jgi:hypothetical protein